MTVQTKARLGSLICKTAEQSTAVRAVAPIGAVGEISSALVDDGKNTMATQLLDRLREAIISGQLEAGSKINLSKVRESFEVSLSPLREALARLIADGLVEFEDNRGYRVAPVSLSNLEEVTRLREEFESMALHQAMAVGDVDWEGDVMRALHRLNRTVRDSAHPETLEQWEGRHREFHLTLIAGCRMPVLLNFCRVLLNLNDRYRRSFLRATSGDRNVSVEHSEIAQGAVARDIDFACERLREHINRTGTNLRRHLDGKIAP
jgi:DNA-binding GntR family transcriptional regulator